MDFEAHLIRPAMFKASWTGYDLMLIKHSWSSVWKTNHSTHKDVFFFTADHHILLCHLSPLVLKHLLVVFMCGNFSTWKRIDNLRHQYLSHTCYLFAPSWSRLPASVEPINKASMCVCPFSVQLLKQHIRQALVALIFIHIPLPWFIWFSDE